jgi:hypothetical protein
LLLRLGAAREDVVELSLQAYENSQITLLLLRQLAEVLHFKIAQSLFLLDELVLGNLKLFV